MAYMIKTLFSGWCEVSAETFARHVEHLRRNSPAVPQHRKDEFIKARTRITKEERSCERDI